MNATHSRDLSDGDRYDRACGCIDVKEIWRNNRQPLASDGLGKDSHTQASVARETKLASETSSLEVLSESQQSAGLQIVDLDSQGSPG